MAEIDESRLFQIGELAEEFGLTLRTMRFYEDCGLLKPEREGFTRRYTYRERAKLQLICRAKRLGFSLEEIREFLNLYEVGDAQHGQMQFLLDRARGRIVSLEQQLADGQQTLKELRQIEAQIERHLASPPAGHEPQQTNKHEIGKETLK